jgi:hypothetical protein
MPVDTVSAYFDLVIGVMSCVVRQRFAQSRKSIMFALDMRPMRETARRMRTVQRDIFARKKLDIAVDAECARKSLSMAGVPLSMIRSADVTTLPIATIVKQLAQVSIFKVRVAVCSAVTQRHTGRIMLMPS